MPSDEELGRLLALGDESALARLVERHTRALAGFIARQTGGRDVDDLHQETWVRVARSAERYDPSRRFTTWLFQIAVNLCRDWHRRRSVRGESGIDPDEIPVSGVDSARVDAMKLLGKLSESQREVVILRHLLDMSEAETAETLGVPAGTVKSRLHSAMTKLAAEARETGPADKAEKPK